MSTFDVNAYREAYGQDTIKIGEQVYPLKTLTFTEAIEFSNYAESAELTSPDNVAAFVEKFAAVSGVPADALAGLSSVELMGACRFFSESLLLQQGRHERAITSATASI